MLSQKSVFINSKKSGVTFAATPHVGLILD